VCDVTCFGPYMTVIRSHL